ncbi:MAG TPA: pyridoxamine 5'-phosphate oxidase family protein [Methanoregula sp.]|nr:pyridoxamine 5'-phosphate oxidase family protein [Methanoregula sp.]
MVKLTDEMKESLAGTRLAFLATSSKDRVPNVVPIGAFRLLDDGTLLISDQFFKKTIKNLKENPKIALSWWGDKGGFQLKGPVTIHTDDEVFRQDVAWMKELRPTLTPKSAVVVKISEVYQIKAGADAGKKLL